MSQVNKYANKAGYTADKNRKDTQSAVSYIEDDGALIYDGVNVVVDKPAAGVGDLAVFDKTRELSASSRVRRLLQSSCRRSLSRWPWSMPGRASGC